MFKIIKILFFVIIIVTLVIYLLHKLLEYSNSKVALVIDKIWDEWFSEQFNAILAFVVVMILLFIINLLLRV